MNSYSGKFVLRIPVVMHRKIAETAQAKGASLNQICIYLLNKGLSARDDETGLAFALAGVTDKLKKHFGDNLAGIVLFGSRARGEETLSSDIDLLVVLSKDVSIVRQLYTWWDSEVIWQGTEELNPHFVNYLKDISEASGLWFEVALNGKVLYQKEGIIDKLFLELKNQVAEGNIRRYISNGHPYWVRSATKI